MVVYLKIRGQNFSVPNFVCTSYSSCLFLNNVAIFHLKGAESSHNKAYWSGGQYIGVGPGKYYPVRWEWWDLYSEGVNRSVPSYFCKECHVIMPFAVKVIEKAIVFSG